MSSSTPRSKLSLFSSLEPLEARIAPAALLVSNLNDSGAGSLRAALLTAETHQGDSITFAAALHGTITLNSSLPGITSDLTLKGPGSAKVTIDAGGLYSLFSVEGSNLHDSLSGLKITGGVAAQGGGVLIDDAGGQVTLSGMVISGNHVNGLFGASGTGGGVAILNGSVTMQSCTVSGNLVTGGHGFNGTTGAAGQSGTQAGQNGTNGSTGGAGAAGGSADGGGIYNAGALRLLSSTISGNTAIGGTGGNGGTGGRAGTATFPMPARGGRAGRAAPAVWRWAAASTAPAACWRGKTPFPATA